MMLHTDGTLNNRDVMFYATEDGTEIPRYTLNLHTRDETKQQG